MNRGRPHEYPDPNYRSAYEPSEIVESDRILGLFNRATGENAKSVSERVKDWFTQESTRYGWDNAEFVGNRCVLSINVDVRPYPDE